MHLVDRAEDLVDFAHGDLAPVSARGLWIVGVAHLVFEEDGRVEVWDFGVYRFADHFAFACVDELAHFWEDISSISQGISAHLVSELAVLFAAGNCPDLAT